MAVCMANPIDLPRFDHPFAVFAIAPPVGAPDGMIAAVTRIGGEIMALPGGKVDPGEDPITALRREAREEGWILHEIELLPIFEGLVDGKPVWWFRAAEAVKTEPREEDLRRGIMPVEAWPNMLSGFLNEEALNAAFSEPWPTT